MEIGYDSGMERKDALRSWAYRGEKKLESESSFNRIRTDILLYPAIIYLIAYKFIGRTNFGFNLSGLYGIPMKMAVISRVIVMFYAVYSFLKEEDRSLKAVYACLILLGIVKSEEILMIIPALSGKSLRRWLSIGVGTVITMFGITIVSAAAGFIGMGTHGAWEGNFFGMETQGQFGFVLLFLLLQVTVLRRGKFAYYEYVAMCIIVFFNAYFYTRRNPNICMIVLILMLIGREIYIHFIKGEGKLIPLLQKYIFDYTFILSYGVFTICVFLRNYIRRIQVKLPWLRSLILRFDDTAEIWRAFPPTLFGRNIRTYNGANATVLLFDPQFSSTLLFDGIIMLVVMMVITTYFMVKARKKRESAMYIAFMVMALFSISDPVVWDMGLNFLICLPFTIWDLARIPGGVELSSPEKTETVTAGISQE